MLVSLMLHLGLAVLVSSTLPYTAVMDAGAPPLAVTLAQAPVPDARPVNALPPTATDDSPRDLRQGENPGPPRQTARFLADPDLSVLEQIPTTIPGKVTLRLEVTSQGAVAGVKVIRADPLPRELLDGLLERFGKARLAPATIGSQPIASTVEVTIRVDPPAQFLDPAR